MSTSNNPSLTLHAEFLPNIRQTTLYITHPADLQPTITLSESRRAVTVSLPTPLEDVLETIKLPVRVNAESRRVLDLELNRRRQRVDGSQDEDGRREMSFRMQIDPSEIVVQGEEITGDYVPWMAGDMGSLTRLRCRGCGNVVLDNPRSKVGNANGSPSTGWAWKDLPSGNWAEMMDFWHCHKPDSREDERGHDHGHDSDDENFMSIQERNSQVKGYGAANRVVATPGTVLVDVATFLVAEGDCKGLKKTQNANSDDTQASKENNIHCAGCETLIGIEDLVANGWRLLKASLAAYTPSEQENENQEEVESTWQSHPTETIVAAQLLELVERESARRFVVHCGQKDGLLLWVFNPSLRYSSTSPNHSITTQHAMKIFYQHALNIEALLQPESGKASSLSLEELQLPANIFTAVEQALGRSNSLLPVSARGFREWRVGVLDRFQR